MNILIRLHVKKYIYIYTYVFFMMLNFILFLHLLRPPQKNALNVLKRIYVSEYIREKICIFFTLNQLKHILIRKIILTFDFNMENQELYS